MKHGSIVHLVKYPPYIIHWIMELPIELEWVVTNVSKKKKVPAINEDCENLSQIALFYSASIRNFITRDL